MEKQRRATWESGKIETEKQTARAAVIKQKVTTGMEKGGVRGGGARSKGKGKRHVEAGRRLNEQKSESEQRTKRQRFVWSE